MKWRTEGYLKEFFTQIPDVVAHRITFSAEGFFSPNFLIKLAISEDTPFVVCQQVGKVVFLSCQMNLMPVTVDFSLFWINSKSVEGDNHLFLHAEHLKTGMAFQYRHDYIKCRNIFFLEFNYQYTSDIITPLNAPLKNLTKNKRIVTYTAHPLATAHCFFFDFYFTRITISTSRS